MRNRDSSKRQSFYESFVRSLILALLILLLVSLFTYFIPDNPISLVFFKAEWCLRNNTDATLKDLGKRLKMNNGGHIPWQIDLFISEKYSVASKADKCKIADFYVSQALSSREGGCFHKLGEALIDNIIQRIDEYNLDEVSGTLRIIEGTRRKARLYKPSLVYKNGNEYIVGEAGCQTE